MFLSEIPTVTFFTLGFSGNLSGDGNFIKAGNYTLTLSGTNSITGTKTISGGTLSISSDDNLGAVPGSVESNHLIFNGGTLQTTAGFTLNSNRGINLSGNGTIHTNTSTQLDYGGLITGTGSLTKSGAGILLLSANNNFTGNLNLDGGTLSASAVGQLGRTTGSNSITFDGGTLLATSDFTLDSSRGISLDGTGTFNVGSGVTLDYAGVISGSGFAQAKIIGFFAIFFTISFVNAPFADNPKKTSAFLIASDNDRSLVSIACSDFHLFRFSRPL